MAHTVCSLKIVYASQMSSSRHRGVAGQVRSGTVAVVVRIE